MKIQTIFSGFLCVCFLIMFLAHLSQDLGNKDVEVKERPYLIEKTVEDKPEFHVKVVPFITEEWTEYQIVFTNDGWKSQESINYFKMTGNFPIFHPLLNKETAIKRAKEFKTFAECLHHNRTEKEKYTAAQKKRDLYDKAEKDKIDKIIQQKKQNTPEIKIR